MPRAPLLALALAALLARAAADAPAGCSRAAPCANFGSCELHTGACACPLGFGGRLCERTLLGACAVTTQPPPPPRVGPPGMLCASGRGVPEHGQTGVKACECLRQCVAHESGGLGQHGICFERPGGAEAQHSAFPAADEAGIVYRRDSRLGADGVTPSGELLTRDAYLKLQAEQNLLQGWEARAVRACAGVSCR
jgi:hypothetical protein